MEKRTISIDCSNEEMLFGIHFTECIAEDLQTGVIEEGSMLCIGFVLFSINIFIKK